MSALQLHLVSRVLKLVLSLSWRETWPPIEAVIFFNTAREPSMHSLYLDA